MREVGQVGALHACESEVFPQPGGAGKKDGSHLAKCFLSAK